jgi:RHS repeat-associated protein
MNASFGSVSSGFQWETLYGAYRYDAESGLYQVRYRYFHPRLGRWIARDPLGYEAGSANLYAYVANNPMAWVDSFGLQAPAVAPRPIVFPPGALPKPTRPMQPSVPPRSQPSPGPKPNQPRPARPMPPPAPIAGDPNRSNDPSCRPPKPKTQEECDAEWAEAKRLCTEAWSRPWAPPNPKVWGKSLEECPKGLVSEECGGNPIARLA